MLTFEWNFLGLSTETKPKDNEKVIDGSTYYECDTTDFYVYYDGTWYKQTFITEDGINVYIYKLLMNKMFKKMFDTNISKAHILTPDTGSEIEFTTNLPASITDLTGYGDTFQATYTGKNLIDSTNTTYVYSNSPSQVTLTAIEGGIRMTNNGGASQDRFAVFKSIDLTSYTGKVVRMKATFGTNGGIRLYRIASDGSNRSQQASTTVSDSEISFTVPEDLGSAPYLGYVLDVTAGGGTTVDFTDLIMVIDNDLEPYEPYTGGIPAPNSSYPVVIETVTGEQTIVNTCGDLTSTFTLDLDTAELCKIGDYQDYIYKNGDDWYIHKEINKITFTGAETENWSHKADGSERIAIPSAVRGSSSNNPVISNRYVARFSTSYDGAIFLSGQTSEVGIVDFTNGVDTTTWKSWLETHNVTIYYALSEPSEAKITNTTFISQLNAICDYTFPVGTNDIVITSENLPILLKLTITERE